MESGHNTNRYRKDGKDIILVIDDEPNNIRLIIDTLESECLTILSARNGEMGLKRALLSKPDLILLDVMLPGMNGFETCRLLKAQEATKSVPVLFMTILNDEVSKVTGFDVGGVDYITKPVGEKEVLARVRTHLNLRRKQMLLERLAAVDGLTEIPNRRQFDTVLEKEWWRSLRTLTPLSLIMIDVDYFKSFNDRYGHTSGDECLRKVAQTLAHSVRRTSDFVARYGGEEFAVVLPGTRLEAAADIAEQIRKRVEALKINHPLSEASNYITISLGVASLLPSPQSSPEDLLKMADNALYDAKVHGRNQAKTWALLVD